MTARQFLRQPGVPLLVAILAFMVAGIIVQSQPTEADWRVDAVADYVAITASGATSDQLSGRIQKPADAKGLWTYLDVTVGAVLLLDVNLEGLARTSTDYVGWFSDCPSDGGVTGVGGVATSACIWGPGKTTNDYAATVDDMAGSVPTFFRFRVDHGNATASTYVLYYQWIW